jgi:hypothetical protein
MSMPAREAAGRGLRRKGSQGGAVPVVQPDAPDTHPRRAPAVSLYGCQAPDLRVKLSHTLGERLPGVLAAPSGLNQFP